MSARPKNEVILPDDKDIDALKKRIEKFLQFLSGTADGALKSPHLLKADAKMVRSSQESVQLRGPEVLRMLTSGARADARAAGYAITCLWELLGAAFLIGSHGTAEHGAKKYFDTARTAPARAGRSTSPRSMAIAAAIEAETSAGAGPQGIKPTADRVNKQLTKGGAKTVSDRTVRRRLHALRKPA
jgi:hypothetical protein